MRKVVVVQIALFLLCAAFFAWVSKAEAQELGVDIVRKGYFTVDGVGGQYASDHTAIEAAADASLQCGGCPVTIHRPPLEVTVEYAPPDVEEPIPDPDTEPPAEEEPTPPLEPVEQAVFGYELNEEGSIENPRPLAGAEVEARVVYIDWVVGGGGAKYWCCKAYDGEAVHEPHWIDGAQPPGPLEVDLSGKALGYERELYADFYFDDGSFAQGNFALFTLIESSVPTTPPLESNNATLSWTVPDKRTNGQSLAPEEIDHYELSWAMSGAETGYNEVIPGGTTQWEVQNLSAGAWDFSIIACDVDGRCSAPSNVVSVIVE